MPDVRKNRSAVNSADHWRLGIQVGEDEPFEILAPVDCLKMVGVRLRASNQVFDDADDTIRLLSLRDYDNDEDLTAEIADPRPVRMSRHFCKTPSCLRRVAFSLHPETYRSLDDYDYCDGCIADRQRSERDRRDVVGQIYQVAQCRRLATRWETIGNSTLAGGILAIVALAGSRVYFLGTLLFCSWLMREASLSVRDMYRSRAVMLAEAARATPGVPVSGASFQGGSRRHFSCGAAFGPDADLTDPDQD